MKWGMLMVALLAVLSFGATSCSDDDGGGQPEITGVRVCDPEYADSLFTKSAQGQTIAIIGKNLGGATNVYINDQEVYFSPTMNTDHSIIVKVPSETDGFKLTAFNSELKDEIRVETNHGSAVYGFKVLGAAPSITRIQGSYPRSAGDVLNVYGLNLYSIENIYFPFDVYTITEADKETIRRDAEAIKKMGKDVVIVYGHTDNYGTDTYNKGLSKKRAETVAKYLIECGIPAEKVTTEAMSFHQPAATNKTKEGRALKPTPLGEVVTQLMLDRFNDVIDVEFTAGMEDKLDEVEAGKLSYKQVLRDFYAGFHKEMEAAEEALKDTRIKVPEEVTDEICELCGRNMVVKIGRFGKFLACPGYPECKNAKPIVEHMPGRCPKCGAGMLKRKSKKGYAYYSCETGPSCGFMTWDVPTDQDCPACGQTMFKRSGKGRMKPFCINENCEKFLPEDKRGYYKKPEASAEAAEGAESKEQGAGKTAGRKTTAKKTTAGKTAAKKTAAAKKTTTAKKPAAKKTTAKKTKKTEA